MRRRQPPPSSAGCRTGPSPRSGTSPFLLVVVDGPPSWHAAPLGLVCENAPDPVPSGNTGAWLGVNAPRHPQHQPLSVERHEKPVPEVARGHEYRHRPPLGFDHVLNRLLGAAYDALEYLSHIANKLRASCGIFVTFVRRLRARMSTPLTPQTPREDRR